MKRIFLVRHGESEFNVRPELGKVKADHAIELTPRGMQQARDSGAFLNSWLDENVSQQHHGRIRMWTSPYERTRRTAGFVSGYCHEWIKDTREHVLLCEQQFGLFDGLPESELPDVFPAEHAHYQKCQEHEGRFWARMPLGESRFDVATRVHQAFGTFHRDADRHGIDHIIVVCHGVTLRAFVMMWLHLTPEWFDAEPNPKNCAIRLIEDGEDKGYIFEGFDRVPHPSN